MGLVDFFKQMGKGLLLEDAIIQNSRVVKVQEGDNNKNNDHNRIVESAGQQYTVKEEWSSGQHEEDGESYDYQRRSYTATNNQNGNSVTLFFESRGYACSDSEKMQPIFCCCNLWKDTVIVENSNIHNINDIRYKMDDYNDVPFFLDRFVIVTPEERKNYHAYVTQVENEESKKSDEEFKKRWEQIGREAQQRKAERLRKKALKKQKMAERRLLRQKQSEFLGH